MVVVGMILAHTALAVSFPDVAADAQYAAAVEALSKDGIFAGDENGLFNPERTITRAEYSTIICRLLGVEDEAKQLTAAHFSDVPVSHWAVGYVAKATELGIINGKGDGTFAPAEEVTSEQAVKMLICAVGFEDEAVDAGGWPDGYMSVARDFGYLDGIAETGNQTMPRAHIALLLHNYMIQQGGNDE